MPDEINDANTGSDANDTGSSPDVELQPLTTDDGLVSTVEYEAVEKESAEEADSTGGDSDTAEQNTGEDQSDEKAFHDHPRFKELIEQKNTYKAQAEKAQALEQRLAELEKQTQKPEKQRPKYENIMEMNDDQLIEQLTDRPKEVLSKFAQQLWYEFQDQQGQINQQEQQKTVQEQSKQNLQDFFADKQDGIEMLQEGKIQKYIADNPGHNAISAYYALAGDSAFNVQDRIDKAVAEAKDQFIKELKAKGDAGSISSAPGGKQINTAGRPEIKNPDKFGGTNAVLLKLMRERMTG